MGSKDKSETPLGLAQLPPIVIMNWVGEMVVLVVVEVVVVVVLVGSRSCRKGLSKDYIHCYTVQQALE